MATKRKAADLSTKYQALMDLEKGIGNNRQIAEKYGVPRTTIQTWLKSKKAILYSVIVVCEEKSERGSSFD